MGLIQHCIVDRVGAARHHYCCGGSHQVAYFVRHSQNLKYVLVRLGIMCVIVRIGQACSGCRPLNLADLVTYVQRRWPWQE